MTATLEDLKKTLQNSKNEWRWHVANIMNRVPNGYLSTYGTIARVANEEYGLRVNARHVAWLRAYLYDITGRDTTIPLHRLAKAGDTEMRYDSDRTRNNGTLLRRQEGSLKNPRWWCP